MSPLVKVLLRCVPFTTKGLVGPICRAKYYLIVPYLLFSLEKVGWEHFIYSNVPFRFLNFSKKAVGDIYTNRLLSCFKEISWPEARDHVCIRPHLSSVPGRGQTMAGGRAGTVNLGAALQDEKFR